MDQKDFAQRLTALRLQKGVSARDMSLSLGQSAGYINNIENGVNLPSMALFFYICEYLGLTPKEFFDFETKSPSRLHLLIQAAKALPPEKVELLIDLAHAMSPMAL